MEPILEHRLKELKEAEGMAWANLHAIQGRAAEVEYLLQLVKGEISGLHMDDGTPLENILPPGDKVDNIIPFPEQDAT